MTWSAPGWSWINFVRWNPKFSRKRWTFIFFSSLSVWDNTLSQCRRFWWKRWRVWWSISMEFRSRTAAGSRWQRVIFIVLFTPRWTERNTFIENIVAFHNKLLDAVRSTGHPFHTTTKKKVFPNIQWVDDGIAKRWKRFILVYESEWMRGEEKDRWDGFSIIFFSLIIKEKAWYASHTLYTSTKGCPS